MAGIFTRKTIQQIMNDENLTPEERTDQVFSLYGRAVDDGYVTKTAAEADKQAAVEAVKASIKPINVKESDEYKALQGEYDAYKTRQNARSSDDFKGVKQKFFDTVYDALDHSEKHKPYAEQLTELKTKYEEYFEPADPAPQQDPGKPQFGTDTVGQMPKGTGKSFADYWGYKKQ